MGWLLDTSVVVHLVQSDPSVTERVSRLLPDPVISAVSRVELEAGVLQLPANIASRRNRLDEVLKTLQVLPFDTDAAARYGDIIAVQGFSRRQIFDRMIAAHSIAADLTLISMNAADFRNILGLKLQAW